VDVVRNSLSCAGTLLPLGTSIGSADGGGTAASAAVVVGRRCDIDPGFFTELLARDFLAAGTQPLHLTAELDRPPVPTARRR
jgi:hypothetical protein